MNELKVSVLPVIIYDKIQQEGIEVQNRINNLDLEHLVIDENTVKNIKKLRTELKKEFTEYETSRKVIKEQVNNPYKEFENAYKSNIADKYTTADKLLSSKINEVENGIKQAKMLEVKNYFNEVNNFDFIQFEQIIQDVKLSDTLKSLKTKVDDFLEKISSDLKLIDIQPNKERLSVFYRKTLNLSHSILEVTEDIKCEQELTEVVEEKEETFDFLDNLVVKGYEEEKELFTLNFKCTKSQFAKLNDFINESGIELC